VSDQSDILAAQRDQLADSLGKLEAIIRRVGGYMAHEDLEHIREARGRLVALGYHIGEPVQLWTDRECTCATIADGTNGTRRARCVLHGGTRL
jgi:hypothetical protein